MSASISKIHVSSSTGLSLNDRFTAISSQPREHIVKRSRSRSRSRIASMDARSSFANRRLLDQLSRRHKMQAALKLKRRSMKPTGSRLPIKRGSFKAIRVAANGKPIKTNSLTKVATMKADIVSNISRRPLRRSNSVGGRLGINRRNVGGAAQRVAQRQQERSRGGTVAQRNGRGRSRSRSRARLPEPTFVRGRSQSRGRAGSAVGRGRSRSRSRARINTGATAAIPIKARLGVRPGTAAANVQRGRRRGSTIRRGVAAGRVQKRRNSTVQNAGGAGGRVARSKARTALNNSPRRSRSRTRKGNGNASGQQQQQQQRSGSVSGRGRRGRSLQRNGRGGLTQRNGKANGMNGQQKLQKQQQQQPRRGRSRSRGGRGGRGSESISGRGSGRGNGRGNGRGSGRGNGRGRGRGDGRNLGKNSSNVPVKREDLDKELDQYMATTKTDDIDYLLKN